MIQENGIVMMTEAQWNRKHRAILKRQRDKGLYKEWYIDCKHMSSAVFYREDQTRPFNKKELAANRRKQRELVKTRRERLSCRCCGEYFGRYAAYELDQGLCSFCRKDHTAWQWLSEKKLVPKKDAEAYASKPAYWDPWSEEWIETDREWYYYDHTQVGPVTDARYEKLKKMYIEKYGGWSKIDLKNTTYNGKKWW